MEFNPKIAIIAAGAAFVVSFLLGIISGGMFVWVIAHALIFAGIFFALAMAAGFVFSKFLNIEDLGDADNSGNAADDSDNDDDADGTVNRQMGANVDIFEGEDADALDSFPDGPPQAGGGGQAPAPHNGSSSGGAAMSQASSENSSAGVEQNNDFQYTSAEVGGAVTAGAEKKNSFGSDDLLNIGDFVPDRPKNIDIASPKRSDAESTDSFKMGTVEMSVGKQAGKKIELSDLGDNVDGKKVAQAIQTLLRKDDG